VVKKNFLFFIFIFIIVLLIVCMMPFSDKNFKVSNKLTIVTTTSIIADAVRTIAGDAAIVYGLMGPGVDPHLYRARESDVHKLAAADIVFYNGLHLEGKMGQVLEGMHRFTTVIAVSDALDKNELRIADFEGMYDPHIWFDVTLWMKVVVCIQKELIVIDPINADFYKKNGNEYIQKLQKVHEYIHECISKIMPEKRILITAHDAFGYFGRAYGFEVVGLQGLSTDSDISTKDIQILSDYIVKKKVNAIFVESSIPQRTIIAVQNAVQARGWQVSIGDELYSDALGDNATHADSYCGMVTHNVDAIVKSLVD